MRKLLVSLIALVILSCSGAKEQTVLKIGLVADPQYADKATLNERHYRESLWKLKAAIDTFNDRHVDFVQTLGDVIDAGWESYDSILPIYKGLTPGIENYHLLGNHDFALDSSQLSTLLESLSMPDYYYSYSYMDWRFIVLDATDYSYFSNSLHKYPIHQVDFYYKSASGQANHQSWNSAIGERQQSWLIQELDSAYLLKQKVILFSHMPVNPPGDPHKLWNDEEILDIIEPRSNVVAFINGHNHQGGYFYDNGIHYITVKGMVDTPDNSFGILELYGDSLVLRGYGNQKTLHLGMK